MDDKFKNISQKYLNLETQHARDIDNLKSQNNLEIEEFKK